MVTTSKSTSITSTVTQSSKPTTTSKLWTEKYRPKTLKSFEGLPHLKTPTSTTQSNSNDTTTSSTTQPSISNLPNLLLYGPPGTGKTSFAHIISNKNTLELNASDERGINTIRTKIKTYAMSLVPNKVIILDECENMTDDAQHCLRRIIEDYSHTKFIFITNYLTRIISPLRSRLLKIRFDIKDTKMLKKIGEEEGIEEEDEFYKRIFLLCSRDLRRSINVLQGYKPLTIGDGDSKVDSTSKVDSIIGRIDNSVMSKFTTMEIGNYKAFVSDFIRGGFSSLQFIRQLSEEKSLPAEVYLKLSEYEEKSLLGCSDEIIMASLCQSISPSVGRME